MPSLLLPLIAFSAGILCSSIGESWVTALISAAGAVSVLVWISLKSTDPLSSFRMSKFHPVWIILLFFSAGIFDGILFRPYNIEKALNGNSGFPAGSVALAEVAESKTFAYGDRLEAEIVQIEFPDGTIVKTDNFRSLIYTDISTIGRGDVIIVPAKFSPVEDSGNFRYRNISTGLKRKGIFYTLKIPSNSIKVTGHREKPEYKASELRDRMEIFIEKSGLNRKTTDFLIAVMLGDKDFLSTETRESFNDAGISHVLALSGMHTAIIAGILLWLLFPFNFVGLYKWRLGLTTILLWGYAFISGLAPSIVRACLMATFLLGAIAIERKNSSFNSLCGACFVILVCNPYALFDVGLQMSVLCVAALIMFVIPLNTVEKHVHPLLYSLNSRLLATICATMGSWVLSAWYFNKFPLLFLPANLIALPFLPIFIIISLIYLLLIAIGINIPFMAIFIDGMYSFFTQLIAWIGNDGASVIGLHISAGTVWLWILGISGFAVYLNFKRLGLILYISGSLIVASIASILFPMNETTSGFIIQDRPDRVVLTLSTPEDETELPTDAGVVSMIKVQGKKILIADRAISALKDQHSDNIKCDILILSRGFKGKIEDVINEVHADLIVIHPSIFKKRENRLLHEADSLGIKTYSIRKEGPMHCFR